VVTESPNGNRLRRDFNGTIQSRTAKVLYLVRKLLVKNLQSWVTVALNSRVTPEFEWPDIGILCAFAGAHLDSSGLNATKQRIGFFVSQCLVGHLIGLDH
jgi:hypothetical protein